jgi:mRNA-degrading endonuclease RelE of RelBE toxin-antitoxin system
VSAGPYRVVITRAAEKDLRRLPASVVVRVTDALLGLADDPRARGSKKLRGEPNA